ncbi:MAG: DUF192 domain-containing protein [Candidatus Nanohalobium sp.]
MKEQKLQVNGRELTVEVADTLYTRAKGLSFRGEGKMLFKFESDTAARIDMMLLSKPLYLYFMDGSGEVIDVQKAEPWSFDPRTWKTYSPGRPYRFLLESFEELDVSEGDVFEFL